MSMSKQGSQTGRKGSWGIPSTQMQHWASIRGFTTVTQQRNDGKPEGVIRLSASCQSCVSCCLLTNKNWQICLWKGREMRLTTNDQR